MGARGYSNLRMRSDFQEKFATVIKSGMKSRINFNFYKVLFLSTQTPYLDNFNDASMIIDNAKIVYHFVT